MSYASDTTDWAPRPSVANQPTPGVASRPPQLDDASTRTAPSRPSTDKAADRSAWADIAKGVCITLVVLWHVIMKHYLQIDWNLGLPLPGVWGFLGDQLLPLRLPLFFTISGIFAVNAATRPWRVVLRSRVAKFYYLYLIWFVIHTAVLSFVPDFDTEHASKPLDVLEELTITPTNLWYLYALALYFVIAKLTRGVNKWVILGLALALSIVQGMGLLSAPGDRGSLYQNLIWFLVGFNFKPLVLKVAKQANMRRLVLFAGAYAFLLGIMFVAHAQAWPGVWSLVSLSAIAFGLTGAAMVGRVERVGALLAKLGRNTLPIYIAHMPLLALIHLMLLGPLSRAGTGIQLITALIEPPLLTAVLIAVTLLLRSGLQRMHMGWMYEMPGGSGKPTAKPAASSAPVENEYPGTAYVPEPMPLGQGLYASRSSADRPLAPAAPEQHGGYSAIPAPRSQQGPWTP